MMLIVSKLFMMKMGTEQTGCYFFHLTTLWLGSYVDSTGDSSEIIIYIFKFSKLSR